jgi:hypothetical protein
MSSLATLLLLDGHGYFMVVIPLGTCPQLLLHKKED